MCSFIPKYHCCPLRVWCISGSRALASFLVDLGAAMIVASTMVPPATFRPREARCSFTRSNSGLPRSWRSSRWRKLRIVVSSGTGSAAEIVADEPAHRQRVIQRLFRRWVGQVEPVLQEVQPQHSFQANRRPAVASSWVERFNDGAQLAPGNNLVHLCQELRAASLLAVFVEAGARQGELPHLSQLCCCGCSPIDRRVAVSRPTYSEVP